MSHFVWGTKLSYYDYLQAKSFSEDHSRATRQAGRDTAERVSMEMSR